MYILSTDPPAKRLFTTNVVRLFGASMWHGMRHMYENSKSQ